ncbi:CD225/dispanin family protein [Cellulomonas sp. URHB0016]
MTSESNPHPAQDPSGGIPGPAVDPAGAPPPTTPPAGPPPTTTPPAGPPPGWVPTQPLPATHRYPAEPSAPVGWVVAAMILFWPTGIPALLASHRAAGAAGAGDTWSAAREAASARRWAIVSVCVGAGLALLSILVSVAWVIFAAIAVQHYHGGGPWEDGPGWTERSAPAFPFDGSGPPDVQRRGDGPG